MERVQADPAAPPPRRVRWLRLLVIVATLVFPGFGQGLAGRLRRMVVWVAANLASPIFAVVAPWATLFVLGVIRVVAAADAVWCLRKVDWSPPRHRALAAAAMVATVVLVPLWGFAVQAFTIPSSAMYPTLEIGDRHLRREDLEAVAEPPARRSDRVPHAVRSGSRLHKARDRGRG